MRTDLNMRKGKMVAQGAHASLKATLENMSRREVGEWLSSSFTKICVRADSLEELEGVYLAAEAAGLIRAKIVDSGKTEFAGVPTVTCVAVGPASEEELSGVTGHLKLL